MVGDRVVAGVVNVDRGRPAEHLLDDEGRGDCTQGDVGDGSLDGVLQATGHPRLDRPAALALSLIQLLGHLAEHQYQQAQVVDGGCQETAQPPSVVGRFALPDRGHGQVAARCVAGQEVADARSIVGKQTRAIADATDDFGRIVGVVGDKQPVARLLVPAEADDAVVSAVKDPRLTGRSRRRQQCDPGVHGRAVANETGQHRHPPAPYRTVQDVQAQPVDLDDEQPRRRFLGAPVVVRDQPPNQNAVVGIVVAHRHELGEQRVEYRQQHRAPDRGRSAFHRYARYHSSDGDDGQDLDHKADRLRDEDRPGHQQPLQDDVGETVEDQHQQRGQQEGGEAIDPEPGEHERRNRKCQARSRVRQERAAQESQTDGAPLPHQSSLEPVGSDQAAGSAQTALLCRASPNGTPTQFHQIPRAPEFALQRPGRVPRQPSGRPVPAARIDGSPGDADRAGKACPSGLGWRRRAIFAPRPPPLGRGPCGRRRAADPNHPPAGAPPRHARPGPSWPGTARYRRQNRHSSIP